MKPLSSVFRQPASGLTHLASALAAAAGLIALLRTGPRSPVQQASLAIYGISLTLLFSASAAYHLIRTDSRTELLLRRLDHSAIFLLIAGTYTPVCIIVLNSTLGTVLLAAVWSLTVVGILLKSVFIQRTSPWVSIGLYIVMGWLAVVGVVPLVRALPVAGLAWLLAGGLLYTVGAVVYASKKLDLVPGVFGSHEVWHLFVSAAAAAHFILMIGFVASL